MSIRPLHDRVAVRRIEAETTTQGGIIIPGSAAEKPSQGEVIAIGDGARLENGERRPLQVIAGDRVLFTQYTGTEVKLDGETILIMRETDILAVIQTKQAKEKAA